MVASAKESLKIISVSDTKIILHRVDFSSLGKGYDIMKTDNKSR